MNDTKEVYFYQYCKTCKHYKLDQSEDPCNDCLAQPVNEDSHKPLYYVAKKENADGSRK